MGIKDLGIQNKCLLSKWLLNLVNIDGLWQQLLGKKYLTRKTITQVTRQPGDSHFWTGLMGVKDDLFRPACFGCKMGNKLVFSEDIWLGSNTLKDKCPNLYNIAYRKHATVAEVYMG